MTLSGAPYRGAARSHRSNKLSQLSTQARLEIVPKKDHFTILRDPAVERAIQEVYDKVK